MGNLIRVRTAGKIDVTQKRPTKRMLERKICADAIIAKVLIRKRVSHSNLSFNFDSRYFRVFAP